LYSLKLIVEKRDEKEKLIQWIQEEFTDYIILNENDDNANIVIMEIRYLFDWLKVYRLRKKSLHTKILLLLDPSLFKTSPLAIELKIQYFLMKPVKKNSFIRKLKRLMDEFEHNHLIDYSEMYQQIGQEPHQIQNILPYQEVLLRRLIRGEVTSELELFQAQTFLPTQSVPNIVFFIQGFVRNPEQKEQKGWHAPMLIQHFFLSRFSDLGHPPSFLSFRKHLVMLLQIPKEYPSLKQWKAGEDAVLDVIDSLISEYGIYLFIGVGSVYREPTELHNSYREARKARRMPPYNRLSLRYFEEISKDRIIQKCTHYIAEHYREDLSIKRVAQCVNLSIPYFSKLFKKETGRSFVEYVTFVRMQRAVWLLRHTNETIEQISDELGFNTPNYFSSTFKKYAGLSPSEYRATEEIMFI